MNIDLPRAQRTLERLVAIPGISAKAFPAADVRRSAEAVAETLKVVKKFAREGARENCGPALCAGNRGVASNVRPRRRPLQWARSGAAAFAAASLLRHRVPHAKRGASIVMRAFARGAISSQPLCAGQATAPGERGREGGRSNAMTPHTAIIALSSSLGGRAYHFRRPVAALPPMFLNAVVAA